MALARQPQQLHSPLIARFGVRQAADPVAGLEGAGAHRLRPALAEEARHGRLVRQVVAAHVAEVGELQRHLNVGVRRQGTLLGNELLAVVGEGLKVGIIKLQINSESINSKVNPNFHAPSNRHILRNFI